MQAISDPATLALLELDVGLRVEGFSFDLIDLTGSRIGSAHPSRDSSVQISHDSSQDVMRQMSNVTLPAGEWETLSLRKTLLRPRLNLSGALSIPLGEYLFGEDHREVTTAPAQLGTVMQDKTFLLTQGIPFTYSYPVGTPVYLILTTLLADLPALSGRWIVDFTSTLLAAPASYPAGTSRLEIMKAMCLLCGFAPPWFDNTGICRVQAVPTLSGQPPALAYGYGYGNVLVGSIADSDTTLTAPNLWIVTSSGANNTAIVGSYSLPDDVPGSREDIGYDVTVTQQISGLADNAAAAEAAYTWAQTSGGAVDTLSWSSCLDPRHEAFDIVGFDKGDGNGLVSYVETAWQMTLEAGGEMTHNVRASFPAVTS